MQKTLFNVRAAIQYCVIFAFSACLTIGIINVLTPPKQIELGVATAKLEYLKRHAQDYNIIFLGSSRTHRMIDSKAVDTQLNDRGCPMRTFNMGFANLTLEESDYLLDEIIAIPNNSFDMIVIDEPLTGFQHIDKAVSERAQIFSTWSGTKRRLENIWSYQESTLKKLYRTGIAFYGYGYNILNIGTLSQRLFPDAYNNSRQQQQSNIDKEVSTFNRLGGFKILEDDLNENERAQKTHETFLANIEAFKKTLENAKTIKIKQDNTNTTHAAKARAEILNKHIEKISQNNIVAGFYVAPLPNRLQANNQLINALQNISQSSSSNAVWINYNTPSKFPIIWNAEYWFDPYHLNREGARLMSQDIGRQLYQEICPKYAHNNAESEHL